MHLTRWIATAWTLAPFYRLATYYGAAPGWLDWVTRCALPGQRLWTGLLWLLTLVWMISWATLETGPIGLLTWGVLAVALCRAASQQEWPRLTGIDLLVGAFFATAVIAAGFSSVQPQSLDGLMKFATFLAGYWAYRLMPTPLQRVGVPVTLVVLASLESLIGLYQYINHIQPLATWEDPTINPELKLTRIFGTLKPANPNLLAGFLIPPLALSVGMTLHVWVKGRWRLALLGAPTTALILTALVLTGSRGGFLALAVMGIMGFLLVGHLIFNDEEWPGKALSKVIWLGSAVVALLGLAGMLVVSPSFQHRVASIFSMREDSSNAFRLNVYYSAWQMFLDNWLVGIGPGNATFKLVYGLYMVPGFTALSAYSVPLEIAVEQGLPGIITFATLIVTGVLRSLLALDNPKYALEHKLFAAAVVVGMMGSLMYGVFDTIWYRPSVNLGFWWLVASISSLSVRPALRLLKS
jgi:putative inorganic carbon (hco3(-)) transporter